MDAFIKLLVLFFARITEKLRGRKAFRNAAILLIFMAACPGMAQHKEKMSVHFGFNAFALQQEEKNKIDSALARRTVLHVDLQGHCDSIGSNDYNDRLSSRRVSEVKKYMRSKGIPDSVIAIKALGKRAALNKNMSEAERSLNRRVEIELTLKTAPEKSGKYSKNFTQETEREVVINGTVMDENKQPLVAEISLNDKNGNEIQVIKSDENGKYTLKARLNIKDDYSLVYYEDSSFISSRRINLSDRRLPFTNLKTVLPRLKDGNKYALENFHFVGDTSQLVPASLPSLEALYKLMKKNKSLVIRIEGHVNYPLYWGDPAGRTPESSRYFPPGMDYKEFNQWLSDERAKMVYNYLVSKGIRANRVSTIGYGASKMLFPDAVSESEQARNRRVEINVISFK